MKLVYSSAAGATVNQGSPNTLANAWPVEVTDGTDLLLITAAGEAQVSVTQPLPAGTNSIGTVQPGNTANTTPWLTTINQGGNSAAVSASNALKVDGSAVTQPVSGTVTANQGGAPWSENVTQIGGSALALGQATSANSIPVVLASNQSSVATKSPVNINGSGANATVSTVATLTAPANSVGFILMCLDSSTANIRWRIGSAAGATAGQQLQPGRDTGFIPCAANISIIAESGTQDYDVQWILSS